MKSVFCVLKWVSVFLKIGFFGFFVMVVSLLIVVCMVDMRVLLFGVMLCF